MIQVHFLKSLNRGPKNRHRFFSRISYPSILLAVLFLIFSGSVQPIFSQVLQEVQPQEAGFSSERFTHLTTTMNEYVDGGRLSGAVVLVLRDGKAVYFEAFGERDVESGAAMVKDDIFRIASQTKAIVSVAVMILQERGSLLLSDPVGKYLPEFENTTIAVENEEGGYDIEEAKRPVTIRDLLTHTSGIGYGYGIAADLWEEAGIQGWYFADRDEPIQETVRRMADLPFDAHPGERWVYGYSTDILGALVEEVSGETLDEFLRKNILEPLEMNDTHFYLPESKKDRLAVVYSATDDLTIERAANPGGSIGQGHYLNGPRKSFSGGAGLLSTAQDYAQFLQMLLNEGELNGKRIISPKSVELMTVNHLVNISFQDGVGFGLGFSVVQDLGARGTPGSVGEYGWGGAYHSTYWVDPSEELVVTFFTQLIPATGSDIHGKLRTLIYQALEDLK